MPPGAGFTEDVVELVDTLDLKFNGFGHAGSIPAVLTSAADRL
jgi:hypothetical protein